MEAQKDEVQVEKPKKTKLELDYIANNDTFVVKAETGKTVMVEVNNENWGEAVAVEDRAIVVLKRELPETYIYKLKVK